ncbi:hypothetical protein [Streptomyces wuyuanensis]|uniref:hypothetical protein n=1 Tax=Streptomyces wuyuanensis TaxID=1196353 RepID=UPI003791E18B
MATTAEQLLSALEPLPFPARLTLTAKTARRLADDGQLAPLLADLDARGPYERRIAALAATAGRDADFLAGRLADLDPVVAGYALRAARVLSVPDEAVEAAYDDAPAAVRHRLARLLTAGGRTAPAERMLVRLREEWGDREAARLLPACSPSFVAEHLPGLAHAVDTWTRLAVRHPDPVLDHAEGALADRAGGRQRENWWRLHATAVAALAPLRPLRVLTLLERYGPDSLPSALVRALGPLVEADAERVVAWITSPHRVERRYEPLPPPGVLSRLVKAEPVSLPLLGRHWLRRDRHFAALLKAMAPARRPAFLDAVTTAGGRQEHALAVLELLPRERRWEEVRRAAAASTGEPSYWWDDLDTLAHGPFDEARTALLAAVRRPDADEREAAWPLLVASAARDGGREAMGELLEAAARLRNEQEPVRTAAIGALAEVHPRLFRSDDAALLDRIAGDALEARDGSARSRTTVRTLAERVLAEHAAGGEAALRAWALRTLERIAGRTGTPDFGPLHRVLRRGQEHEVFAALRPWLDSAAERADFRLLLGLARALGPRARQMPELQSLLAVALERGDDETFETAAELWTAAPATRDERVGRIVALEPSAVVLGPVRRILALRRTDLLDTLLGDAPPCGRFLVRGARRPLPDLSVSGRWLPRQQEAAARLAGRTAADVSLPLDERAAAIRAAAPIPGLGHALAMEHKDAPDVVVAEAALGALPRTDRPHDALLVLLDEAGTDRARVAVYAAGRAAHLTPPSQLGLLLLTLSAGDRPAKVTSRKEAARLTARFLPPRQAVDLLTRAFRSSDDHPDVRAAVVRVLPPLLAEPGAWRLLEDAAHDSGSAVLDALAGISPWELAETHRSGYAGLVGAAYDADRESLDGFAAYGMLQALGVWSRYDTGLARRLSRTVGDLGSRRHWRQAVWVLLELALSDVPHPVGGMAPGSVFHDAVAGLLTAMRDPRSRCEAHADRDLPALQRLRALVSLGSEPREQPGSRRELAALLAGEPLLAAERAELLGGLVDRSADPEAFLRQLLDLADALEGAAVTVAAQTASRLWTTWAHRPLLQSAGTLLAAAGRLAGDGRTGTGLLAVSLVAATGNRLGWPEEWRALLRALRRHGQPDVRHEAHRTMTRPE